MNSFSPTLRLGLVFLISSFSALPLQTALAQTQMQTQAGGAAALLGAAPTQGAAAGMGAAPAAQPAQPTFGLVGAPGAGQPGILPRPDFGAQDAQRGTLTPLRAPKLQQPSQFQKFVQESTGKLLPLFGASLFENPMAYAADAAAPAPAEYVLGPGDEVRIQIWGTVDFAGNQTLDRNGQINLPKIGAINLGGVQVKDLESVLKNK